MYPQNKNCALQSIFQYWQNNGTEIQASLNNKDHIAHLKTCMSNSLSAECLSLFGAPIQPFLVVGGKHARSPNSDYLRAEAIVITYVVKNFNKDSSNSVNDLEKALEWEAALLKLLRNYTSDLIDVSYTTERSIEDEIERQSKADIKIIVISYLSMFLYLTLTLGKYSSLKIKVMMLETKIFLALAGVVLVFLSVFSSGGFFTYVGVPATLITLEVIPFLLLAVGVDNIYIMVQTYQNDQRCMDETVESQVSRVIGKVGPSMLLSGVTQCVAFLISAMTPMPGVRAFSLYASLAIILNFVMQITCFVVLLTLDAKREKNKRLDILCFVRLSIDDADLDYKLKKSFLFRFFRNIYTPFILHTYVRPLVILVFMGFFCFCISMCDKIKIGFDQQLAMPIDSYQIKYFNALKNYLAVGPPVYFVLKGNYEYNNVNDLSRLCGLTNCKSDSLQSIISTAALEPSRSFISQTSVNWLDDYIGWLRTDSCCATNKKTQKFCDINQVKDFDVKCRKCDAEFLKYDLPTTDTLNKYIKHWLNQNPSRDCIKAGHALYGDAVRLIMNKSDPYDYEEDDENYEKSVVKKIGRKQFKT
jgi:Niemann-Pick C1 protein